MSKKAYLSNSIELEVQFYDVDAMRVVWHGNYVKYLERARCELLKKIDYNYSEMEASGYLWPIVDMRLKYIASAQVTDLLIIEANLVEYETRMKIEYIIKDAETGKVLNKAYTIQVAVDIETQEMLYETPAVFKKLLLGNS